MLRDCIERMKKESERRPLCWQEIKSLKIFAGHFPEARELLLKCSQGSVDNQKNNLPPVDASTARSFRRE